MAERHEGPSHCGQKMSLTITASYHIQPGFEPYRAIGGDKRIIRNRSEHRDFLKRFNKIEIGNDASMAPPKISDEEFAYEQAEKKREIVDSFAKTAALERDLANLAGET